MWLLLERERKKSLVRNPRAPGNSTPLSLHKPTPSFPPFSFSLKQSLSSLSFSQKKWTNEPESWLLLLLRLDALNLSLSLSFRKLKKKRRVVVVVVVINGGSKGSTTRDGRWDAMREPSLHEEPRWDLRFLSPRKARKARHFLFPSP